VAADWVDVAIVGGGPVGLYGLYSAGLHGLSARLFERLPALGGQLEALYPEKVIYDVAGYPAVTAHELVEALVQQALQFRADVHLDEEVTDLAPVEGGVEVVTPRGRYPARAVVVAAGIGEFRPRKLGIDEVDRLEGRGVHYVVRSLRPFFGHRVVVVGGGDSAADWALNLVGKARTITLVHRRDSFQCHADSARKLAEGPFVKRLQHTLVGAEPADGYLRRVRLRHTVTGAETWVDAEQAIIAIGLVPDLGPLARIDLGWQGTEIPVDPSGRTRLDSVYAAGDIVAYPAKIKLIATGFGEVATAIYDIARRMHRHR
jgi:thioredoxin reductase